MAPRNNPRRRNGFSPPYPGAQISAWIALIASYVQFLVFITPVLPLVASIPATLYFSLVVVAVVYFGGKTQLIDPIDVHLATSLRRDPPNDEEPYFNNSNKSSILDKLYQQQNPDPSLGILPHEEMKQCWICDTQVAEHSMHCKFCNKCVYHFDHHCMWMNTCVGSANYTFFFQTMQCLFIMEVSHLVIQLTLLLENYVSDTSRFDSWFNADLEPLVAAVYIFFIIFNVISIILIGQLLSFHIGLQRNNLTTYQYIVEDHKKKREEIKRLDDLNEKRILAMAEARQKGAGFVAMRLRVGGICRDAGCAACDPMDLPQHREPDPEAGFATALGGPPAPSNDHSETAAPMESNDGRKDSDSDDENTETAKLNQQDEGSEDGERAVALVSGDE